MKYFIIIALIFSFYKGNCQNAWELHHQAWILNHSKKYAEAKFKIDKAIEINPKIGYFYLFRCQYLPIGIVTEEQQNNDRELYFDYYQNDDNIYIEKAVEARKKNDYYTAIENYTQAIKLEPNNCDYYAFRAYVYFQIGDTVNYINGLNKSIEICPSRIDSYQSLFYIYTRIGEDNKAIELINKACLIDKDNPSLFLMRAEYYKDRELYSLSLIDYFNHTRIQKLNNYGIPPIDISNEAFCLAQVGRMDDAISKIKQALSMEISNPDHFTTIYTNAYAIFKLAKEYDLALYYLNQLITLNPTFSFYYLLKANVYKEQGKYEEAINEYSNAIILNPKSLFIYEKRIEVAYNNMEDYENTIKYCLDAIKIDTNHFIFYEYYGQSLINLKRYSEAIAILTSLKNKTGYKNETVDLAISASYFLLKNYPKAIEHFNFYSDKSKDIELYDWNILVLSYAKLGDYKKAISISDSLLVNHTNDSSLYFTQSIIYSLKKDYSKTLESFFNAVNYGFKDSANIVDYYEDLSTIHNAPEFKTFLKVNHLDYLSFKTENSIIPKNTKESSLSNYLSDIDINIPKTEFINDKAFALIIGNEDYASYQKTLNTENNVPYAIRDANSFKRYLIETFGIPERNITLLQNATAGQMVQAISKIKLLAKNSHGDITIFFYYAGHGLPDEATKEPYLMPVDIAGGFIKNGIMLADLYNNLTEYPTKKTTIVIDACFSGGGRDAGLVVSRGVKIEPKAAPIKGNTIVFSSSSSNQSSLAYNDKLHGLFTYFFLKKIQESNGLCTYKEMSDYLANKIPVESLLINNKEQNPEITVSPAIGTAWETWIFRD